VHSRSLIQGTRATLHAPCIGVACGDRPEQPLRPPRIQHLPFQACPSWNSESKTPKVSKGRACAEGLAPISSSFFSSLIHFDMKLSLQFFILSHCLLGSLAIAKTPDPIPGSGMFQVMLVWEGSAGLPVIPVAPSQQTSPFVTLRSSLTPTLRSTLSLALELAFVFGLPRRSLGESSSASAVCG